MAMEEDVMRSYLEWPVDLSGIESRRAIDTLPQSDLETMLDREVVPSESCACAV